MFEAKKRRVQAISVNAIEIQKTHHSSKPVNMGSTNEAAPEQGLGQQFTTRVKEAAGPKASPRLREVTAALIQHIHDFAREVQLTTDEWMLGVQMVNEAGQMSDAKRNEGQLLCDVLGLES